MKKNLPDIAMALSLLAVIISGYVNISQNNLFKLAGTQWILIGIVLAVYALYLKRKDDAVA